MRGRAEMGDGCPVIEEMQSPAATLRSSAASATDWPAGWWRGGLAPGEVAAGVPDWADFVMTALAGKATYVPTGDAQVFEPVVAALLDETDRRLRRSLYGSANLAAALSCRAVLADRLARTVLRTLLAELDSRVTRAKTQDLTGRRHLDALLRHRSSTVGLTALLGTTPLLARVLGIQCLSHVEALVELVTRLDADYTVLIEQFGTGEGVAELKIGTGDSHRGGRSVAMVVFTDGSRVVYKPRSGAVQTHLADVLDWYRAELPLWAPRLPRTLTRAGYCWEEFIEARPCADAEGVERFYRRQGTLLALLYVLGCTDVHYENVIAHGDEPVVIDIETVFHPLLVTERLAQDPAARTLVDSVARVGLLPLMIDGEDDRLDVSGLGGGAAGTSPHDIAMLAAEGTDGMHLVRRPVDLPATPNRPELAGVRQDPAEHTAAILAGFRLGYETLSGQLDTVSRLVAECADDEIRVVVRDTWRYAFVLDESTHPSLLGDAARHEAFLRRAAELDGPLLDPLLDAEVAELWNRDVPVMVTTPTAREVRSSHPVGGVVPVSESSAEHTAATLDRLAPRDRRVQEWIIEASLATRSGHITHSAQAGTAHSGTEDADPDRLIAQACAIADELCSAARAGSDRVNWLGLEPSDGSRWALAPMGAGLGDGYTGVALFLQTAHRVTGIGRYAEVAARAVSGLPDLLDEWSADAEAAAEIGGGATAGLGGIAWAVAHLLSADALGTSLELCRRALANTDSSIAYGLAGLAVTMRSIAASTVAPEHAAQAGELARIAAARITAVPGGTGGALHGPTAAAWARGPGATPVRPDVTGSEVSWCSGIAGRLAVLDGTAAEVEAGVRAISLTGPLAHHAVCHGELGVLEALQALSLRGHATAGRALRLRAAALLGSIAASGPLCGTPGAVGTSGFLHGLAGIGHGLLRLAAPKIVPSMMMFDPVTTRSAATTQ